MERIEKKLWPEYFDLVASGQKTFELRLADFSCSPGDLLVLREWNPETEQYSGRTIKKVVTFVSLTKDCAGLWPDAEIDHYGFQVIGFNP